MTIESLCHALNVSTELGMKLARENGLCCAETDPLTPEQITKLQVILLRLYRPGIINAAREAAPAIHEPAPAAVQAPPEPAPPETPEPEKPRVRPAGKPADPVMERLVLEKKIMIDTCSLMHDKCSSVILALLPALEKHGKKLLVPEKVITELYKHRGSRSDQAKAASANRALRMLQMLREHGCLSIRGERTDNFADNAFYVALSQYRTEYHMLLITQDRGLTRDVLQLNQMRSVRGHPIEVMYVNGRGELSPSSPY